MRQLLLFVFMIFQSFLFAQKPNLILFEGEGGVLIHADEYRHVDGKKHPFILLCHQAGYSRGEYLEIAPKLYAMGFDCIALDQRSGLAVNGVENRTASHAKKKRVATDYLSAEKDILVALEFIYKSYNQKVILWGSSYSASLALKLAVEREEVKAVIAFSPGEYFPDTTLIHRQVAMLKKPCFVSSSLQEAALVTELMSEAIDWVYQFIPTIESRHGSSALWESTTGHEACWTALKEFFVDAKLL